MHCCTLVIINILITFSLLLLSPGCVKKITYPTNNESTEYFGDTNTAKGKSGLFYSAKKSKTITLGPGDIFEVRVFMNKDLSNLYRVPQSGYINFPLIGKINVTSRNQVDIAEEIQNKLGDKYLQNPQVSIFIKEFRSMKIFVFGEVKNPGTFPFEDNMTIIQALTLAGGFSPLADKNKINITRVLEGKEKKIIVPVEEIGKGKAKNLFLQPDDIVYIPQSYF